MIDVSEYVGLPYAPVGRGPTHFDCYGLIQKLYRERLGIELPDHTGYTDVQSLEAIALLEAGKADWIDVEQPAPWDAVLFKVEGEFHHIGMVIGDGWMIHTTQPTDAALARYTHWRYKPRIEGFYRYAYADRPSASAAQ